MLWDIEEIKKKSQEEINGAGNLNELEDLRIKYLGRKGIVSAIFLKLPEFSAEEKPLAGRQANELKNFLTGLLDNKTQSLKAALKDKNRVSSIDITLPGIRPEIGQKHPITQILEEICEVFTRMGFNIIDSPEIETEFNNFTALNIPLEHPSRDAFDTFYLEGKDKLLLRSHTSPGQIRVMKEHKPPLAVVVPGKVYRPLPVRGQPACGRKG